MDILMFACAALANWRITHLLQAERGLWDIVARLRLAAGEAMDCFLCVSLWPALPFALLIADSWRRFIVLWPALSAIAILIERLAFPATFLTFTEDEETDHVLRQD